MKKVALIFFLICFSLAGFSQFNVQQWLGGPTTLVVSRGGFRADSGLIIAGFSDTAIANRAKYYAGAIIRVGNKLYQRDSVAQRWIEIAGGVTSVDYRAGTVIDTLYYTDASGDTDFYYIVVKDGLIQGGIVTYAGFGLQFYVSASIFRKAGQFYTTNDTTITLSPLADADSSRVDVFIVNTSGEATTITGTESANPLTPQIDADTDVYLTHITLTPTNPTAGVDTIPIYDEKQVPPEWTGSATGVTVNFAGATNVYRGDSTTDVGAINNGDIINYTNTTTVNQTDYNSASFFIRLKAAMPSNNNLNVAFFNGGAQVSSEVAVPLTKSNTSSYQGVSLGMNQFAWTNNLFDRIRFRYSGGGGGIAGFYLDFVYLQSGLPTPPAAVTSIVNAYRTPGVDSIYFTKSDGSIVAVKDSTGGGSSGDFVDTIYRKAGQDSIFYTINGGAERAIKDSLGSGQNFANADLTATGNRYHNF